MQTAKESFIEEAVKTGVKFIASMGITYWIIWPMITSGAIKEGETFVMTLIFTINSIAWGYLLRRHFNGRT